MSDQPLQDIRDQQDVEPVRKPPSFMQTLIWDLLLVSILLLGAVFRFTGIGWDQNTHMHPDERFLTMVATSIEPVKSIGDYFNTETSSLNPHNRGYGFYVYGTLPMFIVRYAGEWLGQSGYDDVHLVGRAISGLLDLGTLLLVFLIVKRLYQNQRMALIAALFYALSVLPIQLSHFFKEDTFMTFFATLTIYFAIRVLPINGDEDVLNEREQERGVDWLRTRWGSLWPYALFGIALGMAVSSKINAAPLALLLPSAVIIRFFKTAPDQRMAMIGVWIRNVAIAGFLALLVFRIFQPYAFAGPGFFNVSLNERWVGNMKELAAQNSGDVDFPPQLQWARRPVWFGIQNMIQWGFGLPLGLLAWAGFLVMGWRILRGDWAKHTLLWGWTALYVLWQSSSATPSMRYFMPVYPILVILAAWVLFHVWNQPHSRKLFQSLAVGMGVVATLGTLLYAYAFLQIYIKPFTRVEASRWIYDTIPAPVNVPIDTGSSVKAMRLPFSLGYRMTAGRPIRFAFTPQAQGDLIGVDFPYIKDNRSDPPVANLLLTVLDKPSDEGGLPLAYGALSEVFLAEGDVRGRSYQAVLDRPVQALPGTTYYLEITFGDDQAQFELYDTPVLVFQNAQGGFSQPLPEFVTGLRQGETFNTSFSPVVSGKISQIDLTHVVDWEARAGEKILSASLMNADTGETLATGVINSTFLPTGDVRGQSYTIKLDQAVQVMTTNRYNLTLVFQSGPGVLAVYGSKHALETSWDDALPLGIDGYSPYDIFNGIYRTDLNFEMYWDDNAEKRNRFERALDQADLIYMSSNRQWGTTVRVPERYPLTTLFYRELIGCPADKEVFWCYAVAQPGMFQGRLGYDLVKVVQSEPQLGSLMFNSQFGEEAFSVYDHPKVMVFQKTGSYNAAAVRDVLRSVDLTKVVHLTPAQADKYPGNLLLPANRLDGQRRGGTWSELFDREALQNKYPGLAVALWYVVVTLLGWVVYPMVRMALRGLPDRGYPLARTAGMVLLAYPTWLAGSAGIPFTKTTITLVALGLVAINLVLGWIQRRELLAELRANWRSMVLVEVVGLLFFGLFLLVRIGNPDLWHPWKGGEKPMDFSYFNAVLKSTTFPPFDPWFAGGYINYYYYGFVLVGVPVKWLGIVPATAYNIILPQLFSLLALGGFSAVWNLLSARQNGNDAGSERAFPFWPALGGAVMLNILGNLGTIRMIWHGLMRLVVPGESLAGASIFEKIGWTVTGIARYISGNALPYPVGDWYWIPSRAYPGEPITEFPSFTFAYADLHAHMIALPVTVLALAWALSIFLGRWRWGEDSDSRWKKVLTFAVSLLLGGLAIGTLRPTNTWDFPTYLALGSAAIALTAFFYADPAWIKVNLPDWMKKASIAVAAIVILAGIAVVSYQPFTRWFGQGYNSVYFWSGDHTPWWSYITHLGVFLFLIVSWMVWETREWMAHTPVSALNKLRPFIPQIYVFLSAVAAGMIALTVLKVSIGWTVLPLMAWAGVLILRPGLAPAKRAVLFLTGTALALSLLVELIALRGDIGRMNTVFKFTLQAWTLFAVCAAASAAWLLPAVEIQWSRGWRVGWMTTAAVLVGCAAMFPVMGWLDKIRDRIDPRTPVGLDGAAYMQYSTYNEAGINLDLSADYRAILWMQQNVQGSPVIVEGNVPEYRWGNRYTINTGLPSVVGWNWHQRQQRALTPESWVTDRVQGVNEFYSTFDRAVVESFLKRYDVEYIVVGGMEHAIYPADSLVKFDAWDGDLWSTVYRDGDTVIYQVKR